MAIIRWKPGAVPEPWFGRARHWYDGDTLYVAGGPTSTPIRLYGIDAPEWGQTGAGAARDALRILTRAGPVHVVPTGRDRYGRIVARLQTYTTDDVGAALLHRGLVWWEYRHAPNETHYADLQRSARSAKLGIWSEPTTPWAPWVFRRRKHLAS